MKQVHLEQFERYLRGALSSISPVPPLPDAMIHMLFPGGKRLRPHLALQLCAELGGDPEALLPGAAALELLHTASLVHDDLPAIDNDSTRRGRESCHVAFGEATAILVGDYLAAWAFREALRCSLPAESRVEVLHRLTEAFMALCSGQQGDILPPPDRPSMLAINREKTGALFGAALALGVVAATGANPNGQSSAWSLGVAFGVLFQLKDDRDDGEEVGARGVDIEDARSRFLVALTSLHESVGLFPSRTLEVMKPYIPFTIPPVIG